MTEELKKDQKCQQVYEPQSDILNLNLEVFYRENKILPQKNWLRKHASSGLGKKCVKHSLHLW